MPFIEPLLLCVVVLRCCTSNTSVLKRYVSSSFTPKRKDASGHWHSQWKGKARIQVQVCLPPGPHLPPPCKHAHAHTRTHAKHNFIQLYILTPKLSTYFMVVSLISVYWMNLRSSWTRNWQGKCLWFLNEEKGRRYSDEEKIILNDLYLCTLV